MSTLPRPSSSSSQLEYSSSGSSDSPFNIGGRKWIRLLLLTVVVYLALLPLWWYTLQWLGIVSGDAANLIYGLFDGRVSISPDGRIVRVFVADAALDAQPTTAGLRLDTVTYGLPMFTALVIVTRADSLLAKVRALVVGLGVMTVLTVIAVMAWAKLTSLGVDERIAQSGDRSSFLYYAFHGYAFSQPAVAILIWLAILMLGMFKRREGQPPVLAVARNAPCPCGSGRKYKKCCGARKQK
jgi:hypothetical protein